MALLTLSATTDKPKRCRGSAFYAQSDPIYAQSEPIYAQSEPIYAQRELIYGQSEPIYAQSEPIYAQSALGWPKFTWYPLPGHKAPRPNHTSHWDQILQRLTSSSCLFRIPRYCCAEHCRPPTHGWHPWNSACLGPLPQGVHHRIKKKYWIQAAGAVPDMAGMARHKRHLIEKSQPSFNHDLSQPGDVPNITICSVTKIWLKPPTPQVLRRNKTAKAPQLTDFTCPNPCFARRNALQEIVNPQWCEPIFRHRHSDVLR